MATYNKRGGKIKKPRIKGGNYLTDVEFDGDSTTQEVFDGLDETASKSEQWLQNNQKIVYSLLGGLLVVILSYMAYNSFVKEPKEIKATNFLAYSKLHFNKAEAATEHIDSLYNVALSGINNQYGLLDIANKFPRTQAGNMANYMAGISYLKINEYDKAIEFLNNFSSDDEILAPMAKAKIGDAFADINQLDDAFNYYKQAVEYRDNSFSTPLYLFKAGNTALELGKFDEALKLFTRIKTDFPNSPEVKEINIYINRAKHASR